MSNNNQATQDRKGKNYMIFVISAIIIFAFLILSIGPAMSAVESPKYEILKKDGNIETRLYNSMIIAEVEIKGNRKDSIGSGFQILADYIFGNNISKEKIKMTSPVGQEKSEKIAMTAPVMQEENGQLWKISFVMPSKYTLESLPKPNSEKIIIKEIPTKKYVVIKFSGFNSPKNMELNKTKLSEYVNNNNINVKRMKYAFYNPPWTLPPMRRNEIMFELE